MSVLDLLPPVIRFFSRQLRGDQLPDWMNRVLADDLPSLHSLVSGLRRDLDAVTAGLSTPWSSGQVEGHVTRVKLLKRMCYGRANLAAALTEGEACGRAHVDALAAGGDTEPGRWTSALHMFDYNTDHLGPGTLDDPAWKIPDRTRAYTVRALAARAGLWGNHGYEADYEIVHTDQDGRTLNGAHRYEVTFSPPPPADAFWSLTMYDTPEYHLVDNPIDRYSIGDRTPGLRYDDGSVTIHLQTPAPDGDKAANWLPAPGGDFRPILRMYEPGRSILDGTYVFPPVRRVA